MKGSRIKAKRITELQVALRLFLLDYDDVDHYERFRILRGLAESELYASAFDSGVVHADARAAVPDDHSAPEWSNRL